MRRRLSPLLMWCEPVAATCDDTGRSELRSGLCDEGSPKKCRNTRLAYVEALILHVSQMDGPSINAGAALDLNMEAMTAALVVFKMGGATALRAWLVDLLSQQQGAREWLRQSRAHLGLAEDDNTPESIDALATLAELHPPTTGRMRLRSLLAMHSGATGDTRSKGAQQGEHEQPKRKHRKPSHRR
jgi:hypothetical protein